MVPFEERERTRGYEPKIWIAGTKTLVLLKKKLSEAVRKFHFVAYENFTLFHQCLRKTYS